MYPGGGVDQLLQSPSNPFQSLWLQGLLGPLGLELPPIRLPPRGPQRGHPGGGILATIEAQQGRLGENRYSPS